MNERLKALYEEDRQDAQRYPGGEAFLASQARRCHAERLVASEGTLDADDLLHAAFLFQHGERLEHWWRAHELAFEAHRRGHPRAGYTAAAGLDRWLMHQGLPQRYGTNSTGNGARALVWPCDPRTTDAERQALGVPPLAELVDRVERMNRDVASRGPQPLLEADIFGEWVDVFVVDAQAGHAVPPYEPLRPADPRPGGLPAGLTGWRFGRMFCAKTADDEVVLTWHRCEWGVVGDHDRQKAERVFNIVGQAVTWLDGPDGRVWSRLVIASSAAEAWIVGGQLPGGELERKALGLL